ncbi:MAG: hypothetical protein QM765_02015 [Myxococcales bacterium]
MSFDHLAQRLERLVRAPRVEQAPRAALPAHPLARLERNCVLERLGRLAELALGHQRVAQRVPRLGGGLEPERGAEVLGSLGALAGEERLLARAVERVRVHGVQDELGVAAVAQVGADESAVAQPQRRRRHQGLRRWLLAARQERGGEEGGQHEPTHG